MSHEHTSTKVVVVALLSNLAIAVSKFIGALISGSASLMAEAIHSVVDCSNQGLLLVGAKKSQKAPDSRHPLGYGRENFFWSFIVAILLFSLGGLFAIYEGVHKISHPEPIDSPLLALGILFFGVCVETYSFTACYKEIKKQNRFGSLWQWFKKTTSSDLLVIFTEDLAALLGLAIAAIFLVLSWINANPFWDSIGSIAVGSILVVVAILLAAEIKALIIGEAPSHNYEEALARILATHIPESKLLRIIALQMGSNEVMITMKISQGSTTLAADLVRLTNQFEVALKKNFPEIRWSFVEIDDQA